MIKEIQENIISKLSEITEAKTVDVWHGDIEDMLKSPQKLPALFSIYQGCGFREKEIIGTSIAPHDMTFLIVLLNRNLKSHKSGSEECYLIIEKIRERLIEYKISPYGWLWPVKEELIIVKSGILGYGLEYKLNTRTGG